MAVVSSSPCFASSPHVAKVGRVLRLWCGFAMGQGIQKCCEQRDDIPKEVVTHKFDENEKDNVDEGHPTQHVKAGKLGLFSRVT